MLIYLLTKTRKVAKICSLRKHVEDIAYLRKSNILYVSDLSLNIPVPQRERELVTANQKRML